MKQTIIENPIKDLTRHEVCRAENADHLAIVVSGRNGNDEYEKVQLCQLTRAESQSLVEHFFDHGIVPIAMSTAYSVGQTEIYWAHQWRPFAIDQPEWFGHMIKMGQLQTSCTNMSGKETPSSLSYLTYSGKVIWKAEPGDWIVKSSREGSSLERLSPEEFVTRYHKIFPNAGRA